MSATPMSAITAGQPISEKVDVLQTFLGEHYFHPTGIMYSQWYMTDTELRPFHANDFTGQSVTRTSAGFSRTGYASSENSPWVSGLFLWSQCLRYQATGQAQALRYAERAFGSLDAIFRLGEATGHKGFLCKPYDWTVSEETSPDQYVASMLGMWAYRALADDAARRRIDALLPAMADWWRERDYTIAYFERRFAILDAGYHAPTMACLHSLAYQVTGDLRYQNEARRLLALAGAWPTRIDIERGRMLEAQSGTPRLGQDIATAQTNYDLGDAVYDVERAPFVVRNTENRAAMWMMVAVADYFAADASLAPLIQQALARYLRHCQLGLRDDLLSHYVVQIDLERETWYPLRRSPTPESRAWAEASGLTLFAGYDSEVCWGDAVARFADMGLIGHLRAPALCPGALALTRAILTRLDTRRLHWMIDPDGQQLLPELRWMGETLSSDVPVFTLLAYWRARRYGIAL